MIRPSSDLTVINIRKYMAELPAGKVIVLFDGVCNLCSSSVQFILRRDTSNRFLFGSLQGDTGQAYLKHFNLPSNDFHSFMLVENDRLYSRSSGILRMLKILGRGWQLLYCLMIVPKFIRDGLYVFVAKNRYKWFGKKDACWIPRGEWKEKFLN